MGNLWTSLSYVFHKSMLSPTFFVVELFSPKVNLESANPNQVIQRLKTP